MSSAISNTFMECILKISVYNVIIYQIERPRNLPWKCQFPIELLLGEVPEKIISRQNE